MVLYIAVYRINKKLDSQKLIDFIPVKDQLEQAFTTWYLAIIHAFFLLWKGFYPPSPLT